MVEVVGIVMSHPEPAHHGARAGVVLHGERHDLLEAERVLMAGMSGSACPASAKIRNASRPACP